jgi:hypothetical protein
MPRTISFLAIFFLGQVNITLLHDMKGTVLDREEGIGKIRHSSQAATLMGICGTIEKELGRPAETIFMQGCPGMKQCGPAHFMK